MQMKKGTEQREAHKLHRFLTSLIPSLLHNELLFECNRGVPRNRAVGTEQELRKPWTQISSSSQSSVCYFLCSMLSCSSICQNHNQFLN